MIEIAHDKKVYYKYIINLKIKKISNENVSLFFNWDIDVHEPSDIF